MRTIGAVDVAKVGLARGENTNVDLPRALRRQFRECLDVSLDCSIAATGRAADLARERFDAFVPTRGDEYVGTLGCENFCGTLASTALRRCAEYYRSLPLQFSSHCVVMSPAASWPVY